MLGRSPREKKLESRYLVSYKRSAARPHIRVLRPVRRRAFYRRVSRLGSFTRYWLPVCVVMTLIFIASTDLGASHRTSRILGPLLRWFKPDIAEETIHALQFSIRKMGHLTEYAALGMLAWRAVRRLAKADARPWDWEEAAFAIGFAAAYAVSDEMHQAFVPTRDASLIDVMIDTLGATVGVLAVWVRGRWRKRW